jgi:hypothetical protein
MTSYPLYVGSTVTVEWRGLKRLSSGLYVNNATMTFILRNAELAVVVASTAMTYIEGSQGNYRGVIPSSTPLIEGDRYYLDVLVVDATGNLTLLRRLECTARYAGVN